MKFGERIEAALQEMQWGPKELEQRTGVADSTISALTRRGSDRTNYKEALIKGFPPGRINHEWLRNEAGSMKGHDFVIQSSQGITAIEIKDNPASREHTMGKSLADLFDQLPNDSSIRAEVFVKCHQVIRSFGRCTVSAPIHTPDAHPPVKTPGG